MQKSDKFIYHDKNMEKTLLELIMELYKLTEGDVRIDGRSTKEVKRY